VLILQAVYHKITGRKREANQTGWASKKFNDEKSQ
jgi:hypothetical protein